MKLCQNRGVVRATRVEVRTLPPMDRKVKKHAISPESTNATTDRKTVPAVMPAQAAVAHICEAKQQHRRSRSALHKLGPASAPLVHPAGAREAPETAWDMWDY